MKYSYFTLLPTTKYFKTLSGPQVRAHRELVTREVLNEVLVVKNVTVIIFFMTIFFMNNFVHIRFSFCSTISSYFILNFVFDKSYNYILILSVHKILTCT